MKRVRIAQLKARLSEHVRDVRRGASQLAWRDATGADLVFATPDGALAAATRSMGFRVAGG